LKDGQQWKGSVIASLFEMGNEIVCGIRIIEEHSCCNYKQKFAIILSSE
jgi:hypothetical protein